jgi:hypothetical protein
MTIIRLILLLFLGLIGRRIYRAFKSPVKDAPENPQVMDDLTEQDISDADFEEIP